MEWGKQFRRALSVYERHMGRGDGITLRAQAATKAEGFSYITESAVTAETSAWDASK
jgi:hypothetical protein